MKLLRIKGWITYQIHIKRILFLAFLNIVRLYIIKKTNNEYIEGFQERLEFERYRIKLKYQLDRELHKRKRRSP